MVELIVGAVMTALASGATDGLKEATKKSIADGYEKLKSSIVRQPGTSEVVDALQKVEAKPDSEPRRAVLAEELEASGLGANEEILAQANSLLALVRALPEGSTGGQVAHGTGIAQADRSSSANVTMVSEKF